MNDAPAPPPPAPETAAAPNRSLLFQLWRGFWLVTLVVSLAYAWHCFYVPANSVAWADSYEVAQQQAAESGKPVILFFTGEWCVPCRIMKRTVWADDEVTALVNAGFIPVEIDVDQPEAAALRTQYGVGPTPSTVLLDPQGKVLQRRGGGIGKEEFLQMLTTPEIAADDERRATAWGHSSGGWAAAFDPPVMLSGPPTMRGYSTSNSTVSSSPA